LRTKILVGVDFGGTKILTGAMTEKGEILGDPVRIATDKDEEPNAVVRRIAGSVEDVLRGIGKTAVDVEGIGLGVTGPLDIKRGTILECPQLPRLHFFPLRKAIEDHFAVPIFMNNDANCLIYGETLFGSGIGKNTVVGFTLGTGIGCAIIIDRKIYAGFTESAGEIWPSPYLGGTIEELVSGAGVSRIYKELSGQDMTSRDVAALAEQGDPIALTTWQQFGRHLSVAIAWTINVIDPELVILGGSISNAFQFFAPSMESALRKFICPMPAERTNVVCGRLGANAGFIGAAALAIPDA